MPVYCVAATRIVSSSNSPRTQRWRSLCKMIDYNWNEEDVRCLLHSSSNLLSASDNSSRYEYKVLEAHSSLIKYLLDVLLKDKGKTTTTRARLVAELKYIMNESYAKKGVTVIEKTDVVARDAFDISIWMPVFTLHQFRKSEEKYCFLISNPDNDLVTDRDGNYITWKSRSEGAPRRDATAIREQGM